MEKQTKIQHYVPRFYLKHFAITKGKTFLINCFDKFQSREFVVNIRNIGCEGYFYDDSKDINQLVEKTLGKLESKFNVACNKLIANENLDCLKRDEEIAAAYFVATQLLRTKEQREVIRDMIRQLTKRLAKNKLSKEFEKELSEVGTKESIKSSHIRMLKRLPKFADIILNMKWILLINETSVPYWTSDHPVNRYNPIQAPPPYGNLGLLSKGIQIFFPLSPKLSLCLCDPTTYYLYPEKIQADDQHVVFQNHLQVKWSTRHIFSVDNNFSLAEQMIEEDPSLRDIDRKRISVY